jgi:argininosuccinate lyase
MPFRQAHHVTGRIVALAAEAGLGLEQLTLAQMQSIEPTITDEVFDVLGVEKSVRSRVSYGGTAPDNVRQQAKTWAHRLASDKSE